MPASILLRAAVVIEQAFIAEARSGRYWHEADIGRIVRDAAFDPTATLARASYCSSEAELSPSRMIV
jgi:hypothetical protein